MKLVSYKRCLATSRQKVHAYSTGLLIDDLIYPIKENAHALEIDLPDTLREILDSWETSFPKLKTLNKSNCQISHALSDIKLLAPLPNPPSVRDAYAFRQHVEAARKNRGLDMIPEFDKFPVFYFSNHRSIIGPGKVSVQELHLDKLDFELEVACVISRYGRNIAAQDADNYIAGLMIMNDFSARGLQFDEMKLNLGPAKGKDFATATGPYLVTLDELSNHIIRTPNGNHYNLSMNAFHNDNHVSSGNLSDMHWTFAQIIERISYGVEIFPGDIIGSGTVGTGCFLELNGTKQRESKNDKFKPTWLNKKDSITLDVEHLGSLKNIISP